MKFILFILLVSLNLNVNVQANSSKYRGGELKLKKTNNDKLSLKSKHVFFSELV